MRGGGVSRYLLTRLIFLRGLGLIYLITFLSLWSQIEGLVGQNGILPAGDYLQAVREQLGPSRHTLLPSLFWLNASDGALNFICGVGALFSLLLLAGFAPLPILLSLWVFYLSLSSICREFLSFQWDILLLETGFLAILFAPLGLRPRLVQESPPSKIVLWLLRFLLFKLMFSSGVVKLSSGDPAWRNLTALSFHYETQPLSTWSAWVMHQMPLWFHKISTLAMFSIELAAPFGIFAPRKIRFISCAALVGLQILMISTGNYCFFNLLAILLCPLLLDDEVLRPIFPKKVLAQLDESRRSFPWRYRNHLLIPLAALILFISSIHLVFAAFRRSPVPASLEKIIRWTSPFRTINGYGLFAVMTPPPARRSSWREAGMGKSGWPMSSNGSREMSSAGRSSLRPISRGWIGRCGLRLLGIISLIPGL